jgi:photosystem II stability/assembly factor-like uncharacterized protein
MWQGCANARSYRLQYARVPDFSTIDFDQSTIIDTSFKPTGMSSNTVYYWRVAAVYEDGLSDWSATSHFETIGPMWRTKYKSGISILRAAIAFPSAQVGIATARYVWSYRTTDGGTTWQKMSLPWGPNICAICFQNASTGYLVGEQGVILKTTDQGATWSTRTSGTSKTLNAVRFLNALTGWVVGDKGTALKTTDAGGTWVSQNLGTTQDLTSLFFADNSIGWISTNYGKLLKSTDAGTTWADQIAGQTSSSGYAYPLFFVSSSTGWRGEPSGGRISKTTNGGLTWASQQSWDYRNILSFYFLDAQRGWAVGEYGTILSTSDGGQVWQRRKSGTTTSLLSISALNDSTAWIVGQDGSILGLSNSLTSVSEDGGDQTSSVPKVFALYQNYPNPFNPSTTIRYSLPKSSYAQLSIFNILGQIVATLVSEKNVEGYHQITWNANVPSGIYFYRLQAGEFVETKKMILLH